MFIAAFTTLNIPNKQFMPQISTGEALTSATIISHGINQQDIL